jgi:hypothetical protein
LTRKRQHENCSPQALSAFPHPNPQTILAHFRWGRTPATPAAPPCQELGRLSKGSLAAAREKRWVLLRRHDAVGVSHQGLCAVPCIPTGSKPKRPSDALRGRSIGGLKLMPTTRILLPRHSQAVILSAERANPP